MATHLPYPAQLLHEMARLEDRPLQPIQRGTLHRMSSTTTTPDGRQFAICGGCGYHVEYIGDAPTICDVGAAEDLARADAERANLSRLDVLRVVLKGARVQRDLARLLGRG